MLTNVVSFILKFIGLYSTIFTFCYPKILQFHVRNYYYALYFCDFTCEANDTHTKRRVVSTFLPVNYTLICSTLRSKRLTNIKVITVLHRAALAIARALTGSVKVDAARSTSRRIQSGIVVKKLLLVPKLCLHC